MSQGRPLAPESSSAHALGHQALRGSAWLTVSHVLIALLSVLRDLWVARLVLPEAFGFIALVRFFLGIARQPFELNLDLALIYRSDRLEDATVAHVWLKGALAGAAFLVILAAQPLLRHWYAPTIIQGLVILGAGSVIQALGSTPRVLLERRLRFQTFSVLSLSSTILQIVVSVSLALRGWGFWSLLASDLLDMLFPAVAFWVLVHPPIRRPPSSDLLRWFVSFSWPMWVGGILSVIIFTIDDFFVGTFAGASALGLYSLAYTMMKRPTQLITHVLDRAWVPAYARLQADRAARSNLYQTVLFWILQLTIPGCIGVALVAPELIRWLVGAPWMGAATLMQLLLIFAIVRSIQDSMLNLLLAMGQARLSLRVHWVEAAIMLLAGPWSVRAFGAVGICWVTNVMMLVGLAVLYQLVRRFVDIRLWTTLARVLLSSALAVAVVEGMGRFHTVSVVPWIALLEKSFVFLAVYGASLWVFNRRRLVEQWRYLQTLWRA